MQKFEEYCRPKRNLIYDRHQFLTKQQQEGESFDQFVTRLKRFSADCEFRELKDSLIRVRIVCGIRSAQLKERMLRDSDLTLDKAITLGRCGTRHEPKKCPAWGKVCKKCQKKNHFVSQCKTKAIHDIAQPQEETSDSDEEFDIGSVTQENKDGSEVCYMATVEGIDVNFKIDTGAQVNILPYRLMKGMKHKLYQTKAKLKTYIGTAITVKGKTDLAVNGQKHEFFIVEDKNLTPTLGNRSAKKLQIIKIMSVTLKEYPTVFGGLGCLKEPYKIQIDKEVKPVICPPRKIPVALQQKLKDKLTDMEHKGVIKKFHVPTEWITLECDSSQFGLGAVVTQRGKPIAYASRSLSEAESRYAQNEKELLAVVFGLERFENLTYGQHVTALSDHKPLEAIRNKPICLSPPRLQRMLIRLHKFNIKLNYKKGKNMFTSGMLSRAHLKEKNVVDEQIEKDIHLYVNQIRDSWNVKDCKLKQIEAETSRDIDLQDLKKQILEGFPAKRNNLRRNLHEFFTNSEELSIQEY
ncbi:retrovirus-related pol polyprotein from transposon 297 [Plakobranchus ocellatus]|uniref:Retrovirus-related pol polyprotein from transposon 297 n=1 Tax=Plakobranchus ocellatus TaxID=259542 RepID=A0AAV4CT83_9GAST|nr:retrovirus-related pol polyprotein from transposon 297 [Plakobranchus ocellatus]